MNPHIRFGYGKDIPASERICHVHSGEELVERVLTVESGRVVDAFVVKPLSQLCRQLDIDMRYEVVFLPDGIGDAGVERRIRLRS